MRPGGIATLLALAVALPSTAMAQSQRPVFALVIGIDAYVSAPPLRGAVNDARGIAEALRKAKAREIVTLLNADASRQRIIDAIKRLGEAAARENGTLIITYAGHGNQEPERIPGDEADGKDEVLVLANFHADTPDNAERLRDNDLYQLFAAIPRTVNILFVADACHSGTLTRSTDPRATEQPTRLARYGPIVGDRLPPPLPSTKGGEVEDLPNLVFVASALDSEVTPEILIEGSWHGAVSWHFAKALNGQADGDGDGTTTLAEFRTYLVNKARITAESRQTPGVQYRSGRGTDPFPSAAGSAAPAAAGEVASIKLWVIGPREIPAGAAAAPSRDAADLIWDRSARQVIANGTSDVIAEQNERQNDEAFIAGVVDKWRAMPLLRQLMSGPGIPVEIRPNGAGARYSGGTVHIAVGARARPELQYLTIVNIAGDGTVQNLFPRRPAEAGRLDPNFELSRENRVQPPWGADHVVAIATADDAAPLREALRAMEGRQAASEAIRIIEGALRGKDHALGLTGLYTGSRTMLAQASVKQP